MRTELPTTEPDFQAKLEAFQAELQYQFKEPHHLELALTHSTFASEARLAASNERLEFLGDSVLNISITSRLFAVFPDEDEGQLSRRRQAIISNRNLAAVAKSLGLQRVLRLGAGQRNAEGYPADSIAANTVEALLGALYLDGGLEAVESVFEYKFDQWVADSDSLGDPKSRLQEACHQQNIEPPRYTLVREDGPDHAKEYTWSVEVASHAISATATSKTKAQRLAARAMLAHLEIT